MFYNSFKNGAAPILTQPLCFMFYNRFKNGAAPILTQPPVYGNKGAACLAASRMSVQFKDYRPSCAKSAYHFEGVHDAVGCRGADYGHALGQCHGGYAAVCGNGAACGVDNYDVGGC